MISSFLCIFSQRSFYIALILVLPFIFFELTFLSFLYLSLFIEFLSSTSYADFSALRPPRNLLSTVYHQTRRLYSTSFTINIFLTAPYISHWSRLLRQLVAKKPSKDYVAKILRDRTPPLVCETHVFCHLTCFCHHELTATTKFYLLVLFSLSHYNIDLDTDYRDG